MQPGLDAAMVDRDPDNQDDDDDRDQHVGGDNEGGVGTERHHGSAGRWLACSICSERTRRRRISLRIAARCSVMNNSENATAITSSGIRKARSSEDPPIRITEDG